MEPAARARKATASSGVLTRWPTIVPRKVGPPPIRPSRMRSEEHTSELQSPCNLVCRLLLEKKKERGRLSGQASRRHYRDRYADQVPVPGARQRLGAFFLNRPPPTGVHPLALHDPLPI